MARVLIVDDDRALGEALTGLLTQVAGHRARHAADSAQALEAVRSQPTDLALLDLRLGEESGLELLPRLKALRPEMSVIVVTALASVDVLDEAMRRGADNFLVKPIDPKRLLALVAKGLEARDLRRSHERLDRVNHPAAPQLVAESKAMKDVVQQAGALLRRPVPVLILGEPGTGKRTLARHIHAASPRAQENFVTLDCAARSQRIDAELFGYERRAFAGAVGRQVGLLDAADGGTLLLDEVGALAADMQTALLDLLDGAPFRRLGGVTELEVDARVMATSEHDLSRAVAEGRFRAELLARLSGATLTVPPLRARREDVLPLARRFLADRQAEPSPIGPGAAALLTGYAWPGNVRELSNLMERAAMLCPPGQPIEASHLPTLPG